MNGELEIVPFSFLLNPEIVYNGFITTNTATWRRAMEKRICRKCNLEKQLESDFPKSKGIYERQCKQCKSESVKNKYRDDPDRKAARHRNWTRWQQEQKEKKQAATRD